MHEAFEVQLLFSEDEVASVQNLRNDVDAIREFEIDKIRFAVFHFIDGGFFLRRTLDVREFIVVVDRGDGERGTCVLRVVGVVE